MGIRKKKSLLDQAVEQAGDLAELFVRPLRRRAMLEV